MIPKLTTGNGFGGSLRYDTRQDQGMKPGLAKVLDVSGVEFDIDKDGNYIIDTKQVARDFRAQTMGYQGERDIRKPVYHWVLSYHPDDKVSEEQMVEDAKEFLKRIGFDDTQYVMTVHYDKEHHHLHIVTNVVNNQGKRIPTMGLIDKAHEAAAAITKERGYVWGKKTQKQSITAEKIHDPHDRARKIIEPIIREAKDKATSLDEFKQLLESQGISCKITQAQDGKRGGISYAYEYEGMVHPFKGSAMGRELSFSFINQAISQNCKNSKEVTKANELRAAYGQMIPTIQNLDKSVRNAFQLYNDTKQAGVAIGTETGQKYGELKQAWNEFRQLNQERRDATTAGDLIKGIGGMIIFLNPLAGLLAIAIGKIATDIRLSNIQGERKALLTKIEGIKSDIDTLQQQKAQIKIEKQERLNEYLQAKDARNEFREGMNTVKAEIDRIKEQIKPKISFDFKAARQQTVAPASTRPANPTTMDVPSRSTVDVYSIFLSAKNKDSLDLALLEKKAVIEPIKDQFGGVSDFKVTLASEGRVVNASNLVSGERMRQMLDKWEILTGEPLAYKQAKQREIQRGNQRKLADICAKMDAASPENAPRIPKDISFLPGGEIKVYYYNTGRNEYQDIMVDANGKMKFNGLILDINTGKYTQQQSQRQTQHHSQEESQGTGKGYGGHGI